MTKKKATDDGVQLELIPTAKSERALNWRDMTMDHAIKQDTIYRGLYKSIMKDIKEDLEGTKSLTITEKKQLGDSIRGAGSWLKQVSEALQISEQSTQDALIAGGSINLDIEAMTDEELAEWI